MDWTGNLQKRSIVSALKKKTYSSVSVKILIPWCPEAKNPAGILKFRTDAMSNVFKTYDLFLCFHECNIEQADKIVEYCEKEENGGYKCYHVDRDSPSGPFSEVLKLALDESKLILMLISNKALTERLFDILMNESLILYMDNQVPIISVLTEDIHKDNLPEILQSFYKLNYHSKYFWTQLKQMLKNTKTLASWMIWHYIKESSFELSIEMQWHS